MRMLSKICFRSDPSVTMWGQTGSANYTLPHSRSGSRNWLEMFSLILLELLKEILGLPANLSLRWETRRGFTSQTIHSFLIPDCESGSSGWLQVAMAGEEFSAVYEWGLDHHLCHQEAELRGARAQPEGQGRNQLQVTYLVKNSMDEWSDWIVEGACKETCSKMRGMRSFLLSRSRSSQSWWQQMWLQGVWTFPTWEMSSTLTWPEILTHTPIE